MIAATIAPMMHHTRMVASCDEGAAFVVVTFRVMRVALGGGVVVCIFSFFLPVGGPSGPSGPSGRTE